MDYGCIGERLSHSFSCEVHRKIGEYSYCLQELTPEELDSFFVNRDFRGINVTIPYKQQLIPYCTAVDENARAIGAVNTIVNRGGKLYGYNTDFDGLKALILRMRFQFRNKKILILGTGGTAATAKAVASYLGAREALCVRRNEKGSAVTYSQAYRDHSDADYLINATPCGMHPHSDEMPVNLLAFPRLQGVLDAVYNPLLCAGSSSRLRCPAFHRKRVWGRDSGASLSGTLHGKRKYRAYRYAGKRKNNGG
ncbi:MAG: hypothetical protein MJ078_02075 [Clostridia bacterium]|nr:hypothetical protein [Clostridia bacterium]